jgi:hypothetical protein
MAGTLPTVNDILSDSRYLGGLLTVGATTFMSPLRPFLLRIALFHFLGHFFVGPYLLSMGPRKVGSA